MTNTDSNNPITETIDIKAEELKYQAAYLEREIRSAISDTAAQLRRQAEKLEQSLRTVDCEGNPVELSVSKVMALLNELRWMRLPQADAILLELHATRAAITGKF